jgi:CheY-like chemotaxis protein
MEPSVIQINQHRILLIEDDPIIQKIHKAYLLKMGYEVDIVADGEQAIAINSEEYDAIILDANLPHLDGFSIAKFIRKREASKQQLPKPLIMLSAYPQEQLAQECKQAAINAFATKPITYEALQAMLFEQLQQFFHNRVYLDKSKRSYQQ